MQLGSYLKRVCAHFSVKSAHRGPTPVVETLVPFSTRIRKEGNVREENGEYIYD